MFQKFIFQHIFFPFVPDTDIAQLQLTDMHFKSLLIIIGGKSIYYQFIFIILYLASIIL
jgi:hypothetical protein